MVFATTLLAAFLINILGFVVAFNFRTDKLTDLAYGLSFVVMTILAVTGTIDKTSWVMLVMVVIWAARLTVFLAIRISHKKRDKRFDSVRNNFWRFGSFWLGQAVSAWVILLPAIILLSSRHSQPLDGFSLIGAAIWLVGFLLEAVADYQKFRFAGNPSNKDMWIDEGLWHISRHPNYLGEILVWVGVYVYVLPFVSPLIAVVLLASPLWISILLLFISGIPRLESSADAKWGGNAKYRAYKKSVPLLIPSLDDSERDLN